jgi:hypothetical protein
MTCWSISQWQKKIPGRFSPQYPEPPGWQWPEPTITGASSMAQAIATLADQDIEVKSVQEFSSAID